LLSTLAAHDLGYLGLPALGRRLSETFATLDKLERQHGHFLNWYDTHTLKPLQPAYVSTVDSGNLRGCLIALKQGLADKANEPVPSPAALDGLNDTLRLVDEEVKALRPPDAKPDEVWRSLDEEIGRAAALLGQPLPQELTAWDERCEHLEARAAALLD